MGMVRDMKHTMRLSLVPVLLASAMLVACKNDPYVPGTAKEVAGVSMGAVRNAIAARLDSSRSPSWITKEEWKRVQRVYTTWDNAPIWLEPDGVRERAGALLRAIEEAPTHGLTTNAYPIDSIRAVVGRDDDIDKGATPDKLADVDVLLTAAFIGYAQDMLLGQLNPKDVNQAWHIAGRRTEVDSALVRALQSPNMDDALRTMAPAEEEYAQLRQKFVEYKKFAATPWPALSVSSPKSLIAQRLTAEGYQADSMDIVTAIRGYQDRHGLEPTGKLNAITLRAMNVPASERVEQIRINLERYRWLPRSLGDQYIYVNVPSFRLQAYRGGQKQLDMRVVVGAEYDGRATPVFADSMEFVVFRPYWNVTPTIQANEFAHYGGNLPAGYEFWNDGGAQRIRQRPGEKNSLGLVKFMFPNSFNIYLHDTPAKSLFQRADRAASHGCIRVQDPVRLAEWVLGWDGGRVQSAMKGSDNRHVKLPGKIPVYIVYFTAYMRDGQLYFSDDVYDRDDSIQEGLDSVPRADSAPAPPPRRAA
ncbi:MAG TPA: L,D-transpeptidase family protein [Gemmatimonadaceae bacterium]|nr:L,D-transpeptidase family protein [Gemmatimonadaceae bacterium]